MGKKQNYSITEPGIDAFQRINYLLQASMLFKQMSNNSAIPAYYGNLAKEVTKKIVGKLHPVIKRSLCKACSCPLYENFIAYSRILPYKGNRKRKMKKTLDIKRKTGGEKIVDSERREVKCKLDKTKLRLNRKLVRARRPNRVAVSCFQCGFFKTFLQRPGYSLWIDSEKSKHI